ncbi:MAG TPA: TIGR03621 family F420-dependent LLM class oxidoreductase [Chloroflexota bacterium]|nr:TIGR03621 family F420-dependent LLM class oxidoreductase [Chloroflexota bacterium]
MASTKKPFRFAVQSGLGTGGLEPKDWAEFARLLEGWGFSVMLIPDHFLPVLSPIPAAMAAAQATSVLHVGPFVVNMAWRHPAVLAKEAATVDFLSGGRFEVGIGTGYQAWQQEAAGVPFESAGERINRLIEYVKVLKGLLANESFSFSGRYYEIKDLKVEPRPVQRPQPPIVVGGNGRRLLRLAAQEADVVGMTLGGLAPGQTPWDGLREKVDWVRETAGPRFEQLELNLMVTGPIPIGMERGEAVSYAIERGLGGGRPGSQPYKDPKELDSPAILLGTVDQVCEQLQAMREQYGLSYITYFPPADRYREFVDALGPVVKRLAGS